MMDAAFLINKAAFPDSGYKKRDWLLSLFLIIRPVELLFYKQAYRFNIS